MQSVSHKAKNGKYSDVVLQASEQAIRLRTQTGNCITQSYLTPEFFGGSYEIRLANPDDAEELNNFPHIEFGLPY